MKRPFRIGSRLLIGWLILGQPFASLAQQEPPVNPAAGEHRDGSHDFDFDFGTWRTHSSRLMHPLTGSKDWADMDGFTVVKKVWGGRANLAEYKADGPAGPRRTPSLAHVQFDHPGVEPELCNPECGNAGHSRRGSFQERSCGIL